MAARSCARAAYAATRPTRLARRHDRRAERQTARLAPPRHGLRAAHALRQAVHGLGHVGAERARHDRDGADGLRQGVAGTDAGDHLADQRQLAAPLRRPHALRAARVCEGRPGDHHHAVPPHGRDVARLRRRDTRAAGRRGARRDRARADDSPGLPGRLRLLPLEHRYAVRLARSACSAPDRSRAITTCRSAAAARSRRRRSSTHRPATSR